MEKDMDYKAHIARQELGFLPTPVMELKRLSAMLSGPRIFMKRDDQTGVAFGGNKVRKLEYLIGEALDLGADTLVTGGAGQSNHCRQTAAAAAMVGIECHLALGGEKPAEISGNLLLDLFFKATIYWCGEQRKGETIPDICELLRSQGKRPYIIPYGGSNRVGAIGFVEAIKELDQQQRDENIDISHLVFASSSGGTHAGMMVGKQLLKKRFELIGIGIDKEEMKGMSLDRYIVSLAHETASHLGLNQEFADSDLDLCLDYLGMGYGVIGHREREAIQLLASLEGVLLDPVYTGRAMGGMIDMIRQGRFSQDDTLLFWHTGGTPALFAYGEKLLAKP